METRAVYPPVIFMFCKCKTLRYNYVTENVQAPQKPLLLLLSPKVTTTDELKRIDLKNRNIVVIN